MMLRSLIFISLAVGSCATQGFNYGAVKIDGSVMLQSDFQAEFSTAKSLAGTNGAFSSARLYTTIQAGSSSDPTSAIPAAIAEGTTLLLGIWASSGQQTITSEIAALKGAISTYGDKFTALVTGLSVGSEDLYRITPTGLANDPSSVGAGPDVLVSYIQQVRAAIKGTSLDGIPIGHVDTWTAWVNGSNNAVINACDFIGMNTFPYFQTTDANSISNGKSLFQAAFDATAGASQGKPVWVTETGWPVGGKESGQAQASTGNAKAYWDAVGCGLFGKTNTWWYTLVDANTDPTQPEFGIVGTTLSSNPLYDLSCDAAAAPPSAAPTKVSNVASSPEPPSTSSYLVSTPSTKGSEAPAPSSVGSTSSKESTKNSSPQATSSSSPSPSSSPPSSAPSSTPTSESAATPTSTASSSELEPSTAESSSSQPSNSAPVSSGGALVPSEPAVVTSTTTLSPTRRPTNSSPSDAAPSNTSSSGSGSGSSTSASASPSASKNAAVALKSWPGSVVGGAVCVVLAMMV